MFHFDIKLIFRQILQTDGVPGLFRGLTATFTREMPGYFCFFFAYEATRGLLASPGQSKDDIGPLRTVISGGVAGVTLWTVIFPADVVKSRLQVRLIKVKPNQMQNTISYISIALVIGATKKGTRRGSGPPQ